MRPFGSRPSLLLVAAATACGLFVVDAQAQWTWRDRDGKITVSDIPPPREVPDQDILKRPVAKGAPRIAQTPGPADAASSPAAAPPTAQAASAAARVDPELEKRRQAAEQAQAAKKRDEEAQLARQRAENCRNARSHLALLESGQRMARVNDKGERVIVTDEQRRSETERTRAVIASDCR